MSPSDPRSEPLLNPRFDKLVLVGAVRAHKQRRDTGIQERVVLLLSEFEPFQPFFSRQDPMPNTWWNSERIQVLCTSNEMTIGTSDNPKFLRRQSRRDAFPHGSRPVDPVLRLPPPRVRWRQPDSDRGVHTIWFPGTSGSNSHYGMVA